MPALGGGATRRPVLHSLQQPVDKVGGGGVLTLHKARLNTLHDGVALPEINRSWIMASLEVMVKTKIEKNDL